MLTCIDSYELTEWMAFERAFGPIGTEWQSYALSSIHQQLQMANGMFGQINFESNPMEDVPLITAPHDWFGSEEKNEFEGVDGGQGEWGSDH